MAKKTKPTRRSNLDGSIYKDGDGYRVQVLLGYDPATGKPHVKKARVKTHAEAVDKLQELQAKNPARGSSRTPGVRPSRRSWITGSRTRSSPSAHPRHEQYRWVLETHVLPSLGKKRVVKIRRSKVQALLASLSK